MGTPRASTRGSGVDTRGRFLPADLTVSDGDAALGVVYLGIPLRQAHWTLAALPENRADYTFIDMGSGKGRMLLVAAQAGYRRSIGIEFADELHAVAANNARIAGQRGLVIEPILGDAGAFEFPDEPLIVHCNNPFHDPVMVRVIANLTESYQRQPRPIVVVYAQLKVEDPEDATGNIDLLDAIPFLTGRTLDPPAGEIERNLLSSIKVRIYESAEVRRHAEPGVALRAVDVDE